MARFAPVSPSFWTDPKVRAWNDAQQKLGLYLLTTPHGNLQGIFRLSIAYLADDLRWEVRKSRTALARLIKDGFVEYDEDAQVCLLPNALAYYQPKTKPQIKGALAVLANVPETPLKSRFMECAERHGAVELVDALTNGMEEGEVSHA